MMIITRRHGLLAMALNGGSGSQTLRSTVIALAFDGGRTVWAPAGDFLGTGYKLSPSPHGTRRSQASASWSRRG